MQALLQFGSARASEWTAAEIVVVVAIVGCWLACAFLTGHVAASKGHDGGAWGLGGLLFGFVALIAAAGMPLATSAKAESEPTKFCPDCAASCRLEARICGQCRFEFPRAETIRLMCARLMAGSPPEVARIAARLSENLDEAAVDELVLASEKAPWARLPTAMVLLIKAGVWSQLSWLGNRIAGVTTYDVTPEVAAVIKLLAGAATSESAHILMPSLAHGEAIVSALVEIGEPAVPALTEAAASSDKKRAKAARRALQEIEGKRRRT